MITGESFQICVSWKFTLKKQIQKFRWRIVCQSYVVVLFINLVSFTSYFLFFPGDVLNPPIKVSGRKKPEPIWYPDTYFLLVHSLIYSAEEQSVEFLSHGQIEFIRKVRLVTPCTPNVLLFPFDIVNCTLQLSSFGNTVEDVRLVNRGVQRKKIFFPVKKTKVHFLS